MIHLVKGKMKANKENKKLTAKAEMEMNLTKHYLVHFFGILLGRG